MIRDGGLFHPYEYNVNFYAKYPATNLPYGPPFFALVFAAAFSLFGISFPVAKCIISFYTVCAGVMCWLTVHSITKNYWVSILAVATLLLYPLTIINSRDITPEVPVVFFSVLSIYFFYNYAEYNKKAFGVATAISFGLGYLTKPYILPLGAAFLFTFFSVANRRSCPIKRRG
jgi:4-amino-4-deoxy-L-arabinose transferase-like glycosyltransferase